MDKATLLHKVEETIKTYKEQLDKHEGSTLAAMATGARSGFDSVMASLENLKNNIMENEKAQKAIENMRENLDKLECSIKAGDKKVSAKAVEKMEELLKEYQAKYQNNDPKDETQNS